MTAREPPIGEDDLQAYIDGRLPEDRRRAVEVYLAGQPEIAGRIAAETIQRDALRCQLAAKFAEPIPTRLRIAHIRAAARAGWRGRARRLAAGIVLFAAGTAAGYLAGGTLPQGASGPDMSVVGEAFSAYRTYVVEVAHPVEVGAANERHLVQWLSKRLGRRIAAPDLVPFGFRLMGGRLLPTDDGVAAQLMYDDDGGRRLTVYICSSDRGETSFRFTRKGEVATFAWLDQGFGFAVTAAVDRDRLLPVAEAVYQALDNGPPPHGETSGS